MTNANQPIPSTIHHHIQQHIINIYTKLHIKHIGYIG